MKHKVMIKSNKYGLVVQMDPDCEFQVIYKELCEKFTESAKFFRNATLGITFEGRKLTKSQEHSIIEFMTEVAHVNIICIYDTDEDTQRLYQDVVETSLEELPRREGQFYRGTLKKKQILESDKSIIVMGDVDFGATVVSKGNIVVLGTIRGKVLAGAAGNKKAFIVGLAMKPQLLKIADVASSRIYLRKEEKPEAKIATLDQDKIFITALKDQEW